MWEGFRSSRRCVGKNLCQRNNICRVFEINKNFGVKICKFLKFITFGKNGKFNFLSKKNVKIMKKCLGKMFGLNCLNYITI